MQCKTERCLIRELVPDDWKSMQKIAVDFRKSKYAVYDMPLPVEDAEIIARTKQFAQTQMFYAVLLHDVMSGITECTTWAIVSIRITRARGTPLRVAVR